MSYATATTRRAVLPNEFRRSHSTRSASSTSSRAAQLNRNKTVHVKRCPVTVPTFEIHDEITVSSKRNGRCAEADRASTSRSSSARGNGRRDSMLSLLNRFWKSDECTRKPAIRKMTALDVPLSEDFLAPVDTTCRRTPLLGLSAKQRKLLRISFAQMNSSGTFMKIMEQVFRRLEGKCPDTRSIFLTTAFVNSLSRERSTPSIVRTEHDHCKCLVDIFDRLINDIDEVDRQLLLFRSYGEKHAQMRESGFTGSMIENFGEIAVAVIGSQDSVKCNPDTAKAWRVLLAYVTDEMKVGFDRFTKISERRGSHLPPSQ